MSDSAQAMIFTFVVAFGVAFMIFAVWLLVSEFKRWLNDGR